MLDQAQRAGLTPINAIHPRAVVAGTVQLGLGIWIAAGVVVNPGTIVGDGAVLNTGATVDHDCRIGAYANVSPGCHLSGRTVIGRYAFLGTGAITLPDVSDRRGGDCRRRRRRPRRRSRRGRPWSVSRPASSGRTGIVEPFIEEHVRMPGILGDSPALDTMMNIVRPVLPDLSEFEADFRAALRSGQVTNNSRFVVEFERRIREYLGVRYALAFCNGETALICMLKAAELTGDIIVPSYTFSGTVHAAIWANLRPVFADLDAATFTIDPVSIESRLTPATTAILAAPVYGNPCDNDALQKLADRRNLTLLYDSASGFGCTYRGRRLGGFGRAEIFSFHATKVFGTMEGGALTTDDPELYERARLLRGFGQIGSVDCGVAGLNGKMMEVAALVGLRTLDTFDATVAHRERIALEYDRLLSGVPGVCVQQMTPGSTSTRLYEAFVLDEQRFGLNRDQLVEALKSDNITARKFLDPAGAPHDLLPRDGWRRQPAEYRQGCGQRRGAAVSIRHVPGGGAGGVRRHRFSPRIAPTTFGRG